MVFFLTAFEVRIYDDKRLRRVWLKPPFYDTPCISCFSTFGWPPACLNVNPIWGNFSPKSNLCPLGHKISLQQSGSWCRIKYINHQVHLTCLGPLKVKKFLTFSTLQTSPSSLPPTILKPQGWLGPDLTRLREAFKKNKKKCNICYIPSDPPPLM